MQSGATFSIIWSKISHTRFVTFGLACLFCPIFQLGDKIIVQTVEINIRDEVRHFAILLLFLGGWYYNHTANCHSESTLYLYIFFYLVIHLSMSKQKAAKTIHTLYLSPRGLMSSILLGCLEAYMSIILSWSSWMSLPFFSKKSWPYFETAFLIYCVLKL